MQTVSKEETVRRLHQKEGQIRSLRWIKELISRELDKEFEQLGELKEQLTPN